VLALASAHQLLDRARDVPGIGGSVGDEAVQPTENSLVTCFDERSHTLDVDIGQQHATWPQQSFFGCLRANITGITRAEGVVQRNPQCGSATEAEGTDETSACPYARTLHGGRM